ncbi:MAG: efflux RND transporter periplasmic adaptor subunit [Bacteroidales bacterium]|nr:efflux RND transporter periplasmic adaptor subunit [Bacteroidales bacterium]
MRSLFFRSIFLISLGSFVWVSCGSDEQTVAPPQQITVVEVIQKDVPIYMEYIGEVYGEKDIPIRARVEGFLEGIHFEEGSDVKEGQLLYTIDPRPLEATVNAQQSEVASAETMMVKAKSDLDRYKPLASLNAVSKSDLDAAQASYDASVSAVEAAKANLRSAQIQLGYTKIYSPINGIIGITKARVGDFVGKDPNPVILNTVSETSNVKVRFYITETAYLYLSREYIEKMSLMVEGEPDPEREPNIELILSDGSIYKEKGTFDFIDRGIDASTGSILIQANFPNPKLILRPGLYAKVKVVARNIKDAILIPQRCIMELQGLHSVYVVNDSNIIESRQVTTGPTIGDYWLIEEGLKANEKVVIDALQKVRPDMTIVPEVIEFESKTNLQ